MIKKIIVGCVLMALTGVSQANVSFSWKGTPNTATYWSNYPNTPAVTTTPIPVNWTLLTYISGDAVVNFDTGAPIGTSYGAGLGQDVFVGATNTSKVTTGTYKTAAYTLGVDGNGPGSYVGSYAYFVLVAMSMTTFTTTYGGDIAQLPVGTLYGVSGLSVQLTQFDHTSPPASVQQLDVGTVVANIALVPEPSSFVLLGLGLGLVGLRRFRRK